MSEHKFDIKYVTEWKAPEKIEGPDPRIICMPNVVKPLHGCLEPETKVLTPKGWVEIQHIKEGDVIMCWSDGALFFDRVNAPVSNHFEYAYKIGYNKKRNFDILYSPDHRLPIECVSYSWGKDGRYKYETPHRKLHVYTAEEFNPKTSRSFYTAGAGTGVEHELSTEERIYIAIQADGSFRYLKQETGEYVYSVRVKKERKKQRMRMLLEKSKFPWVENESKEGYSSFTIWCDMEAKLFSSAFSYSMGEKKAKEFIEELCLWDGYIGVRKVFKNEVTVRSYSSTNYENIEFAQAIAAQAGFTSNTRKDSRKEEDPRRSDCWTIEFIDNPRRTCGYMKKEKVKVNHRMYCVSVNSTFFLAKYHDRVVVTGNCAPRTLLGKSTWDHMRRRCYFLANYTCEICGAEVGKDIEKRDYHGHELYSTDYATGTARFERVVGICALCHTRCIHTGRAFTMYKKGNPFMTAEMVLEGAEHAFSLVHKWNIEHPDEEPLRLYATWIEFAKDKRIGKDICKLIKKYDVKFYAQNSKSQAPWGDWKLIIGNKEYPTPYANEQEWEEKMKELNRTQTDNPRNFKDPFSGGVFDEIKEILKSS